MITIRETNLNRQQILNDVFDILSHHKRRLAFAFSGSGYNFPFHLGAVEAFMDNGFYPDNIRGPQVVSGVSGGALVGSMFCQGKEGIRELKHEMIKIKRKSDYYRGNPVLRFLLGKKSLYDFSPLANKLNRYIQDRFKIPLIVGTVNFTTGNYEIFTSIHHKTNVLSKAILASSSVIPFAPLVDINNNRNLYGDGGFRNQLGDIVSLNVDRLVVFSANPLSNRISKYSKNSIISNLKRGIDILVDEVYANDWTATEIINDLIESNVRVGRSGRRYKKVDLAIVAPKESLGSGMEVSQKEIIKDMNTGYNKASQVIKNTPWLN